MAKTTREIRLSVLSASAAAILLAAGLALIGCENYGERAQSAPGTSRALPGGGERMKSAGGEAAYQRPSWSTRGNPGGAATAQEETPARAEAQPKPAPKPAPQPAGPQARPSRAFPGGLGPEATRTSESMASSSMDQHPDNPMESHRAFPGGAPSKTGQPEEMAETKPAPEAEPMRRETSRAMPGAPERHAEAAQPETRSTRAMPGAAAPAAKPMEKPAEKPEVAEAPMSATQPSGSRAFPGGGAAPAAAPREEAPAKMAEAAPAAPTRNSRAFPGRGGAAPEAAPEAKPAPQPAPTEVAETEPAEPSGGTRAFPGRAEPAPTKEAEAAPAAAAAPAKPAPTPEVTEVAPSGGSRAFPGGAPGAAPSGAPEPQPGVAEIEAKPTEEPTGGSRAFPGGRTGAAETTTTAEAKPKPEEMKPAKEAKPAEMKPEAAEVATTEEGNREPPYGRTPASEESTRAFPGGQEMVRVEPGMEGVGERPDYFDPNRSALIELFAGKNGGGRLVGYTNSAEPQQIVFSKDDRFADNKAHSIKLTNVPAGTVIRLFDSPLGNRFEDWVEIQVKRPIVSYTVVRLDDQYYDQYVNVVYYREKEIMGEVSRMDIAHVDLSELPNRPAWDQIYPQPEKAHPVVR